MFIESSETSEVLFIYRFPPILCLSHLRLYLCMSLPVTWCCQINTPSTWKITFFAFNLAEIFKEIPTSTIPSWREWWLTAPTTGQNGSPGEAAPTDTNQDRRRWVRGSACKGVRVSGFLPCPTSKTVRVRVCQCQVLFLAPSPKQCVWVRASVCQCQLLLFTSPPRQCVWVRAGVCQWVSFCSLLRLRGSHKGVSEVCLYHWFSNSLRVLL